jgi:hypothetical protein
MRRQRVSPLMGGDLSGFRDSDGLGPLFMLWTASLGDRIKHMNEFRRGRQYSVNCGSLVRSTFLC